LIGGEIAALRHDLLEIQERGGLVELAFRALSIMKRHRLACMTPPTIARKRLYHSLREATYSHTHKSWGQTGVNLKLLFHLASYSQGLGLPVVDRLKDLTYTSPDWVVCRVLRRQLDLLAGARTFRFAVTPQNLALDNGNVVRPHEGLGHIKRRTVDANNRFNVLFDDWDWVSDDPSFFVQQMEGIAGEFAGKQHEEMLPTLEDRQYRSAAEANKVRKDMGMPPKKGKEHPD